MRLVHSLEFNVKGPGADPERKWGSIPEGLYRRDAKHGAKAAAHKAESAIRTMEPMTVFCIRKKGLDIGKGSMIVLIQ
jgi:hypothetical protein